MSERLVLDRVRALTQEFAGELHGAAGSEIEGIEERLNEPLRVAVAGRVKAGKSTLVNALLHQAVAPTDVSECTKVVTWFRHGQPQRVEIQLHEGGSIDAQLERDGTLPRALPVEITEVSSLQVFLDNDALRRMTVIDTPGLGSVHEETSASTEQLLAMERSTRTAAGTADAVLFVLNQSVQQEDLETLEGWAKAGGSDDCVPQHYGLEGSAVNAIGVLTKADKIGGGQDPWPAAVDLALRQAEQIRSQVSTVVPVIGLLAETASTAALTERDAGHLQALAALDATTRERMLWSPERFLKAEIDVPAQARRHLLERLDLFGIRYAIDRVGNGLVGATSLTQELARASGIDVLERALGDNFLDARSELLLARSTLDALEQLSYRPTDDGDRVALRQLRNRVEALRLEPVMHELAELECLHSLLTGAVALPDELRKDLERISSSRDTTARLGAESGEAEALRAAAQAGLRRWRSFSLGEADPRQAAVARVMVRSYKLAFASSGGR